MRTKRKLVAFDMDGTLLEGSLIRQMAEKYGFGSGLDAIQKDHSLLGYQKTEKIAALLAGLGEQDVIETIAKMGMAKNWRSTTEELKSHGHVVGIISDSYTLACNYLREKMGLDFAVANTLESGTGGVLTGKVLMPLGWQDIGCHCRISVCKRYHLEKMAREFRVPLRDTVVVGDTVSDLCMIERAGLGIALMPKDEILREKSDMVIATHDLSKIIPLVL